jgi:DMSO/TMAO reductase YedYZ molybdopterin-dependent catalytic subunit
MSAIFSRKRHSPDADRLPPGQVETRKWPVLHYSHVPRIDTSAWTLRVWGECENPYSLNWSELLALPRRMITSDIHCVTRWSRFDTSFAGVSVSELLARAQPQADAQFALVHAEPDYTTNLPLDDLDRPDNLIAYEADGQPLSAEHGGPVRLVVPHLYFWKSAKWITGIQLLQEDYPGLWEQNGYHMRGDPWQEERYGRPDPVRMRRGPR